MNLTETGFNVVVFPGSCESGKVATKVVRFGNEGVVALEGPSINHAEGNKVRKANDTRDIGNTYFTAILQHLEPEVV